MGGGGGGGGGGGRQFAVMPKKGRILDKREYLVIIRDTFIKDGLPYLFHSFRNKYFNKISLGNMLYFLNKL